MKNNSLRPLALRRSIFAGIIGMMLMAYLPMTAQVQFPQTLNADFNAGAYNDVLVGSDNVYLPTQATAVGTWLTTTVLPQTLMGHKAATWNNRYVYVVGGYNNSAYSTAVYRATLQAGGISGWTTLNALPAGLRDHAVVIGTNTIYVLGGRDGSNLYNTIYYAAINADGSIGAWQTSAVNLPAALWGHTAVYCNGYIYVAGGANNMTATTARDNVYYAKVLADNTLSAFSNATSLPLTRNGHSMVVHGDKVYVLGGFASGGAKANTVYFATSGNNGALGSWSTGTAIPIAVSNHSSVVINGIVTVLAGESGTLKNTAYWADITAGTLVWNLAPDVMYDYTKDGAAFASSGQIGYCGGENLSGTPIHNTRYVNLTLSANLKSTGLFVSNPFYQLGAERLISQLTFNKTTPTGAAVSISYRTAGTDKIWSDWTAATSTSPITVNLTKRYLQYKVNFTSNGTAAPVFHDLILFTPGTQLAGNLNAIATFTQAASPYWATSDISFTAGTHTFQAGTTILFLPGVGMTVGQANIICNGTVADSVKFLGYTNDDGLWNGIYFNPDSDNGVSSQLNYTVVANAGNGAWAAGIYCNATNEPLLNRCTFRNSSAHGIHINGSHITMQNSVSKNNGGSGIYMVNSNPSFISSNFTGNGAAGIQYSSSGSVPTYSATTCQNNLYGLYYPSPNYTIIDPNGTLTLTGNTYNGICIAEGTVTDNNRWYETEFDYIMLGNLSIGQYNGVSRLTIEPGNTIKFLSGKKLQIGFYSGWHYGGELYAIGSPGNDITFTAHNGAVGGWEGIYFEDRSDWSGATSVMNHCIIEKGNAYNLYIENTNQPTMNNCIIRNALQDGMKFYGAYNIINTSTFQNNGRYPIYFSEQHTYPTLNGNSYTGNTINLIGYSGGHLSESRTFQNDGINYHIMDNILIGQYNSVNRLTIAKGLTLYFANGKGIQVGFYSGWHHGAELYAVGSADSTITFTPYSGTAGDWTGIYFEDRSDWNGATNHLKYCNIEKANDYNVYCENTNSVLIENCTIRNSVTDGLRYYQSHGTYSNSTFNNNGRYPVYYTNWWSSPAHANNTFTANVVNRIALSGGHFTESRTITKDNAEYLVLNDILIGVYNSVNRLTVDPGVTLNFASGKGMQVGLFSGWHHGGELHAIGTSDSRIVFRSASGINGDWEGLFFEDRSDYSGATSILKYCNVVRGNAFNIRCNATTQPLIDNCIFANSTGHGILIENSTLNITRTRVNLNSGIGLYFDGSSTANIGNADSLTCSIFSNGAYELYNNTANNINARYNFWGTADSAMIAARIYDKSDNTAKGIVYFGNAASIPSLPLATTAMSGWVKYANPGANPMKNAAMVIKNFGGTTIASATTNTSGNYSFTAFTSGNYQMTITPTNAWGGVNSTDALNVLRHFAQIEPLTGMKLAAADVNKSATVNGTDAMLIMRRFAGSITSFPSGDYLYHSDTVIISGSTVTNNIKMLCFGDVDASYAPAKKSSGAISLSFTDTLGISSFTEFNLPVKIQYGTKVGAISLGLFYPQEFFEIQNIQLANGSEDLIFNAENGLVKIAWCNLNPLNLNNSEIMLVLKMKALDLSGLNQNIQLGLFDESVLADQNAVNMEGIVLELPELQLKVTGIDEPPAQSPVAVYPTIIGCNDPLQFKLKGDYHLTIDLINYLGQQITRIADQGFSAGTHTLPVSFESYRSGIYFVRITARNNQQEQTSVVKLVVTQ